MKNLYPYIHRDISWLSFNYRVLQEAKDRNVPLFERLKFLAIYSSNLDEYFRVRVANHKNLIKAGKKTVKKFEFDPEKILKQILQIVNHQQLEFSKILHEQIFPELKYHNIKVLRRGQLNDEQIEFIESIFNDSMIPYVQPVLLYGKRIKPFLQNASIYLAVQLQDKKTSDTNYAIVNIPADVIGRFITLPSTSHHKKEVILLDDIVRHNITYIFPGFDIIDSFSIKLTRDAELYIDDEYTGDLVEKIKKSIAKRKVGSASRLVYDRKMPKQFLQYLTEVFDLGDFDLLEEGRYHNNFDFFSFPHFGKEHLMDQELKPLPIKGLSKLKSIFDSISEKDYLIHVPFHEYEPVVQFFEQAAIDPYVTHIKIIQYRVSKKSRIMAALMDAVKNGKQVSAFIEVKARFDEEANLRWGEKLENAGIQVFYSIPGLKVHSKMAIVRRLENGTASLYTYYSTGNFHEDTAKLYTDVGIFTKDQRITSECMRVFSFLETKQIPEKPFEHILVGQFNLNDKLKLLIKKEVDNAKAGKPARIILKMNSLQDREMINLLYDAGRSGVKIDLIIRGICSLVAGMPKVSENIRTWSIVDRFLEHSRIFIFHNNGEKKVYISSADWMVRNLHHRIETVIPVYDKQLKKIILDIIKIQTRDNVKSRSLHYKHENQYRKSGDDLSVRSQLESYYYFLRH